MNQEVVNLSNLKARKEANEHPSKNKVVVMNNGREATIPLPEYGEIRVIVHDGKVVNMFHEKKIKF